MGLSRRAVIIGSSVLGAAAGVGGWALLADARIVPGRRLVDDALGRCDIAGPAPAEATPGRLVRSSFYSAHRGRSVNYVLAYPPKVAAGAKLPVCLVLHGLGEDERSAFDGLGYHRLLAAAKAPPFVLASIAGGDGYWHPHAKDDPLGMVLEDFPLILAQHGLPTDRFAALGWSMGGFGALLAASVAPERFVAVVANSPAFWGSFDEAHRVDATAFDSTDEWQRYGDMRTIVHRLPARLTTPKALRIDCGESDSFYPAVVDLRAQLPDPAVVHLAPGCHDGVFWRSVASAQLALLGTALAAKKL